MQDSLKDKVVLPASTSDPGMSGCLDPSIVRQTGSQIIAKQTI
jgi:hypothetical protein